MRRHLLLVLAVVFGLLAVSPGTGEAQAARSVTAEPATALGDGEAVRLTWSGYNPFQVVYFRQCNAAPVSATTDCTGLYRETGFTGADGSGRLYERIHAGQVTAADGSTEFTCDVNHPCSIGVFTGSSLSSGVFDELAFAPTREDCPAPTGTAIAGGGSDHANRAIYDWSLQLCGPPASLGLNYLPANSLDGLRNYVESRNDFAVSSVPFAAAQTRRLDQANREFAYAPVSATGLVIAYKVFDLDAQHSTPGAQVTDLRLTPRLAARIFTGQLTNWHADAEINEVNPGHEFPPAVRPLVRGDHSSTNRLFTSWLTAEAASSLPADWPGVGDDYPLSYLTQDGGIVGGDKLAEAIADPASISNSDDYFNIGYIGVIDATQAAYYGLPVAQIQNAAGQYVAATADSVEAAIAASTENPDGVTRSPNFASNDPEAYPLTLVDYAVVPTNDVPEGTATTLKAFLTYAAGDGQDHLPAGYVPLPDSLTELTTAAIAAIHTPEDPDDPPVAPGGTDLPYDDALGSDYGSLGDDLGPGGAGDAPPDGRQDARDAANNAMLLPAADLIGSNSRLVLPVVGFLALGCLLAWFATEFHLFSKLASFRSGVRRSGSGGRS